VEEDKENEAPQCKGVAQTQLHLTQAGVPNLNDSDSTQRGLSLPAATPMPLARPFLEATPEAPVSQALERPGPHAMPESLASKAYQAVPSLVPVSEPVPLGDPAEALSEDPASHTTSPILFEMTPSSPVTTFRGLDALPPLEFWEGELPVKNTFIDFSVTSPATQATSQLSGNTEPKNFQPREFLLQEVEPVVEDPVVISLQHSLASSMPQRGRGSNRIQLNLSVWIPPSSRSSAASEPPRTLCLAEHHFPVPSTAPIASHPAALVPGPVPPVPSTMAAQGANTRGEPPVCRRLFHNNTI